METLLDQITGTFNAGFHLSAITISLSLPDICSTLELPPGAKSKNKVKSRYIAWYNKYLHDIYPNIHGSDLFALRNGVFHSGAMSHSDMRYDRIAFILPDGKGNTINIQANNVLFVDARGFCQNMIDRTRVWQSDNLNNRNVIRNIENVLQFRPQGLAPLVVGVPIIA